MSTLTSLRRTILRLLDKIILFASPPDLTSQVSEYAGVIIEIVPCEHYPHATNHTDPLQGGDGSVSDVKILSAGLPVYIPLENKLLIVGKLIMPLSATCRNVSASSPFGRQEPQTEKAVCRNCQKLQQNR